MKADKNRTLFDILSEHDAYNVVGHVRPDGDSIGSQLAIFHILKNMGKKCFVINNFDFPVNFSSFVDGIDRLPIERIDVSLPLICTDCSDFKRSGDVVCSKFASPFLNIDHHMSNELFAENNIVAPTSASTTEIIADNIIAEQFQINPEIARLLYVGILTDTGRFAYGSTTEKTFEIAGFLVRNGACPSEVFEKIFANERIERYRLLERFLRNIYVDFTNKTCISRLDEKDFAETGALWFDSEGFVDYTRNLSGISVGAYLEFYKNSAKCSLRTSNAKLKLDVFAQKFGGGGHQCAAGFTFTGDTSNFYEHFSVLLIEHVRNFSK